jgi:hypothetical protein
LKRGSHCQSPQGQSGPRPKGTPSPRSSCFHFPQRERARCRRARGASIRGDDGSSYWPLALAELFLHASKMTSVWSCALDRDSPRTANQRRQSTWPRLADQNHKAHSNRSSHHISVRLDGTRPADLELSLNGDIRLDVGRSVADDFENGQMALWLRGSEGVSRSRIGGQAPDLLNFRSLAFATTSHFRRQQDRKYHQRGLQSIYTYSRLWPLNLSSPLCGADAAQFCMLRCHSSIGRRLPSIVHPTLFCPSLTSVID